MAVHCEKCGARVSSRAALPGHYRKAHGRVRHPAVLVPVKPRLARREPIRAEIVPVTPSRSEIVLATRPVAPERPILALEPDWFAREFPQDERAMPWHKRDEGSRAYYERMHAAVEHSRVSLTRRPGGTDSVTLWEQYHFLKALAVRLDAGRGTDRESEMFEAGLAEYDRHFDAIRARKALPG